MIRSLISYAGVSPTAISTGSEAQTMYFVSDAKRDIHALGLIVSRVAALNPDAGEIGPGMLASLVSDARRTLEAKK